MNTFAHAGSWQLPTRLHLVLALAGLVLLGSQAMSAEPTPVEPRPAPRLADGTERIIVKFRQDSPQRESSEAAAAAARIGSLANRRQVSVRAARALGGGMHALNIAPFAGEVLDDVLARLSSDSEVEYAVPDRRVYALATPNDPLAAGQWYLAASQPSALDAQGAWDLTTGSSDVVVAVVDTGALFDHPDLGRAASGGRFLPGYDFVSPDTATSFVTANDGDGRDADPSDPGDWIEPADDCGAAMGSTWHGTRVAGIIAAQTNNNQGVAGIMWNGSILPVRVLGKCGGFLSDVLAGIRWAAGLPVSGVPENSNPAQIINLSLGSTGACDSASADTINQVTAAGALVVVAAGNDGGPVGSPASCPGAMAVLGLRHAGTKVGFSNLGTQIAIGAPGGNCVNLSGACLFSLDTTSNLGPTTPGEFTYTDQLNPNYGTSFSAPMVSGIAGLMLAVNGNLKSAQLMKRIKLGATPYPASSDSGTTLVCRVPASFSDIQAIECICTTSACGAGMANAMGAINEALRPVATISAPASHAAGSTITLQGGGSAGANGRVVVSHAWSVVCGPGAPSSGNSASTTIPAPVSGDTVVQLLVTDDLGRTDATTITLATTTAMPSDAATCVDVTASDRKAAETGGNPGVFTIARTGGTAAALTVNISLGGTALNGADYQRISTSVVIPAGQQSVTVPVIPIDDELAERRETVILTLLPGTAYGIGDSRSATVTLADDETKGGGAIDLLTLCAVLGLLVAVAHRRHRVRREPGRVTFRPARS